ncbi:tRNA (guanine(6)-N2)-methyltransferase THUMP3-like [Saccostrea echinata]|uniref:tRNA (guanine(6)-N2)-methyltransferase THUMP3-like n=1 Tax=Saccostrea echinata TaxID=191078 RepID=UPI002A80DB1C|nr:tRNA (guanine(6)-N2)-methyltransferase THUMP3-like [Saccostrea echinata]
MSAPMDNMPQENKGDICEIEATVVSGFENVAKEEAEEKLKVQVDFKRGRIIFKIPTEDVNKVLELGGIDNCFVVMSRFSNVNFTNDELECMAILRKLVYDVNWKLGLSAWSRIFSFAHPIASTPDVIPKDLGEATLSSRFHNPKDPSLEPKKPKLSKSEKRKLRKLQAREKGKDVQQFAKGENVENTQDLENTASVDGSSDISKGTKESSEISQNLSDNIPAHVTETENNEAENVETDQSPVIKKIKTTENIQSENLETDQSAPTEKQKLTGHDPTKPSFRVTCNRNGHGHPFDSMGAAANFGGGVFNYFNWNVSMKNFDIEVILNIEDRDVTVCLGLTRQSLHHRFIKAFGPTALRATIAYNMLRLCKIEPGEVICDPMCGGGTIPIQSAVSYETCVSLCGDMINNAVKRTMQNIDFVRQSQPISLDVVRWDVTKLPLKTESMDVFITDLPFGIRSGSKMNNWKLYPNTLMEMARACRVERGRACLLTQDKKCINKALSITAKYWKCRNMVGFNMGGLAACVYVLHRTVEKYNAEDAAAMLGEALAHAKKKEGSPVKTDQA